MKTILTSTLAFFLAASIGMPARAQEPAAIAESLETPSIQELSLEDLMNVNVSVASNVASRVTHQPASVTVITGRELRFCGARTLAGAIMMLVPGFFLVEDQDDLIAAFRGLSPDSNSKVMLLINGQNVNTECFWGPPSAILNSMNMEWIERVEIIRGPGSVTLGQGALLGVINIVSRSGANLPGNGTVSSAQARYGKDGYLVGSLSSMSQDDKLSSFFNVSYASYNGQDLRREGWAERKHEGYRGGAIADYDLNVNRAENITAFGTVKTQGFEFGLFYADQIRDLYNFYRDRERFRERIFNSWGTWTRDFGKDARLSASAFATRDDFALVSEQGITTGGTREDRYGSTVMLKFDRLLDRNSLALGYSIRVAQMGRENYNGDNFIINSLDAPTLAGLPNANTQRTWFYDTRLIIHSAFAEDFLKVSETLSVFGAFRYDHHPFWESYMPRLGMLLFPADKLSMRLSYQSGFRGAPGLHYGGGYRQDGFLREENFDKIQAAGVPGMGNLPRTVPEKMHSFEAQVNHTMLGRLNADIVGFYNIIENVIDVGVIPPVSTGPLVPAPNIGTDVPGDSWGGYWYYKNNEGRIHTCGGEAVLTLTLSRAVLKTSHSLVRIIKADEQQYGSMYVTENRHVKAYPENITRASIIATPAGSVTLSAHYLYYYRWYSPKNERVDGNHIVNTGASWKPLTDLELTVMVRNLLGQDRLYPMNNNVSDVSLSNGTPSLEGRSVWVSLEYTL